MSVRLEWRCVICAYEFRRTVAEAEAENTVRQVSAQHFKETHTLNPNIRNSDAKGPAS